MTTARWAISISALLALLSIAAYADVRHHQFVNWDDDEYVVANPPVAAGLTSAGVTWAFTTSHAANWHPLTWLSHMLDVQLFGMEPGPPHLVNLALHTINTLLLFLWLRGLTGALWRSAIVAAIFAVHPLHVESVAWISERKDVLSTCFGLLTLWAYTTYAKRPTASKYACLLGLLALALLSKPMMVTLPVIMLLLDRWPLARAAGWRSRVLEKLPFFALSAATMVATIMAQRAGGALQSVEAFPVSYRLENAFAAIESYLSEFLFPTGLVAFYPYLRPIPLSSVFGGLLLVGAFSWGVVYVRRVQPAAWIGWVWFLIALLPVLGLIQVGSQAHADRYMYFPMIGLLITFVWTIADVGGVARRMAFIGSVAAICLLTVASIAQVATWRDSIALWEHAIASSPSARAFTQLGMAYSTAGDVDRAIVQYQRALALQPDFRDAHLNLGTAFGRQGKLDDALREFTTAVDLDPQLAEAHHNLGLALAAKGRRDEAVQQFTLAINARPDFADAYNSLGSVLSDEGRLDEALRTFDTALRLDPRRPEYHFNDALALYRRGDRAGAIAQLEQALALEPGLTPARQMLADLKR
jgi:tetratricopeptide (TPR) repeat protein